MTDTDPQARDFAAFLLEQSQGRTHTELSEGLRDLIRRCQDTGKVQCAYTNVVSSLFESDGLGCNVIL